MPGKGRVRLAPMLGHDGRRLRVAGDVDVLARVSPVIEEHALARTVVLATGARWRTLAADNAERFAGAGVYYAAMASDAERCRDEDVIVVGGGNSASQAAVPPSPTARTVSPEWGRWRPSSRCRRCIATTA